MTCPEVAQDGHVSASGLDPVDLGIDVFDVEVEELDVKDLPSRLLICVTRLRCLSGVHGYDTMRALPEYPSKLLLVQKIGQPQYQCRNKHQDGNVSYVGYKEWSCSFIN